MTTQIVPEEILSALRDLSPELRKQLLEQIKPLTKGAPVNGQDVEPSTIEMDALGRERQRERLARLLEEMEQEAGPIEPQVLEEVHRTWHDRARSKPKPPSA